MLKMLSYDLFALFDTLQVAFYYGSCQDLYQLKAYTLLLPNSQSNTYYQSFNLKRGVTESVNDSIYIQIRSPHREINDICINSVRELDIFPHYIYDRPAINANISTSVWQSKLSSTITFSPNPTNGFLELQLDESTSISDTQVHFYSLVGGQVAHFSGQTSFDLSNLSKGVYIVEVIQGGKSIGKQKIVVTR
ncbi:MAG: T9SS type A sorting domain-containing protein [Bacteroidota bacterium]